MAVRRHRLGESPFWGDLIGRNPTDRGQAGSKRSLLVEAAGGPLSVIVAGANVHDTNFGQRPLRPSWWNGLSPLRSRRKTCVWIRRTIIPLGIRLFLPMDIKGTSAGLVRRSGRSGVSKSIPPADGWWSAPWLGWPSVGPSWSDTTRKPRIIWHCYS